MHRLAGIVLLLPFLAWSATAVFFLVRPAYRDAYAALEVPHYPLETLATLPTQAEWLEVRQFRSIVGPHLLVRTNTGWQQLDPASLQPRPWPDNDTLRALLVDAMAANPRRYGALEVLDGRRISTDTGVEITLDWDTLSFSQQGRDTRRINRIYSIHYLEWTGIRVVDKFVGLLGLALLMYMTWSGFQLAFGRSSKTRTAGRAATPRSGREAV